MEKITDVFVNVVLNNLKQKSNIELSMMDSKGKDIYTSVYTKNPSVAQEARILSLVNPDKRTCVISYLSTVYSDNSEIAHHYNEMIDIAIKKHQINNL